MSDYFFVSRDSNIMGGKACIRNTQIPISAVVALLTNGHPKSEVLQMFPTLTREDLPEALAYVTQALDAPVHAGAELQKAPAAVVKIQKHGAPKPASQAEAPRRLRPPKAQPVAVPSEQAAPAEPGVEEHIELFHPAYPDGPVVTVSAEGLFDRRWASPVIAWPDIAAIERVSGRKTINVTLRHPERYLAEMPFFKRLRTNLKMAFNIPAFYLDTSSLAIRTKDLYYMAIRLWHAHKGNSHHGAHKRRVRIGKSTQGPAQ